MLMHTKVDLLHLNTCTTHADYNCKSKTVKMAVLLSLFKHPVQSDNQYTIISMIKCT